MRLMEWFTDGNPKAQLPVPRRQPVFGPQRSSRTLGIADRLFIGSLSLVVLIVAIPVLIALVWFVVDLLIPFAFKG